MALITPKYIPHAKFNLYYAGTRTKYAEDLLTEYGYCRLMSYVNEKGAIQRHCKAGRPVFVDSGAFSAMTRGIEINVDDYIKWLNEYSANMEKFCCFDRIGITEDEFEDCAKATWENYLYMYDKLKEPHKLVYCFHFGEPVEYLRNALKFGCKHIALGGIAKRKKGERQQFLDSVKDEFNEYPDVHVHAFGVSDFDLLAQYDFVHSSDSTSWLWPCKFSETQHDCMSKAYWSDKNPEKPHHINNLTDEKYFELEDELAGYGFGIEDMYGEGDAVKNRDAYQIIHWQKKAMKVRGGYIEQKNQQQ
jgi:hypothetical protein